MNILIVIILMLFSSPLAYAGEAEKAPAWPVLAAKDDARPLQPAPAGRVDQIIDGTRLRLNDGRIVQLSGIDVPEDKAPDAKAFLEKIFENKAQQDILTYHSEKADKGRTTRMGHELVQMVRKDGTIWVQGAMIAEGIARAWPTPANPELADKMYALEHQAIVAKRGLWADDSKHRLLIAADDMDAAERLAVVQGTIRAVAMVNNVTYLNFGADWKTDFTVSLPMAVRQILTRQGQDVFKLQGKTVRVRGWVRSYNGPMIELEHPVLLQQDFENHETSQP